MHVHILCLKYIREHLKTDTHTNMPLYSRVRGLPTRLSYYFLRGGVELGRVENSSTVTTISAATIVLPKYREQHILRVGCGSIQKSTLSYLESPIPHIVILFVCSMIAAASEARNISPSPIPITKGLIILPATIVSGSCSVTTTKA